MEEEQERRSGEGDRLHRTPMFEENERGRYQECGSKIFKRQSNKREREIKTE